MIILVPGRRHRRAWAQLDRDGIPIQDAAMLQCEIYRGVAPWLATERRRSPLSFIHAHAPVFYEEIYHPPATEADIDAILRGTAAITWQ
jgi:hypothetical protein